MKNNFSPKPHIVTPVMEERIILVAYGEGSFFDRFVVNYTKKRNPKVLALYESHLKVRESVDSRLTATCPGSLTERLMRIADAPERRFALPEWITDFTRPLQLAGAVAAMLVLSLVIWNESAQDRQQEELELALATRQAKASLALVSEIMNGTRTTLREEILLEQTSRPLRQSIYKGTETIKNNLSS